MMIIENIKKEHGFKPTEYAISYCLKINIVFFVLLEQTGGVYWRAPA